MKSLLKKVIAVVNKIVLFFVAHAVPLKGNSFYLFNARYSNCNELNFLKAKFSRVRVSVSGVGNVLSINGAVVSDSSISVGGNNNQIILREGVVLRGATIVIRGNDCSILIGRNSTFGGVRFINVGAGCVISVGEDCLFADQIEIWASDTHPIYNKEHEIINPEKPITIGNRVWVGSRVIVLKGVTVGDGGVIGMGTIVTKDVPANAISVGNPNRTVKTGVSWSLHPH